MSQEQPCTPGERAPTPETNALFMVLPRGLGPALAKMMEHAQKLERERDALKAAIPSESKAFELEGKLLNVLRLADEYTNAVENEAIDVGGYRPSGEILRELGPAVDEANKAVEKEASVVPR